MIAGLFALAFLDVLSAQAPASSDEQLAALAKSQGITSEQQKALFENAKELGQEYQLATKSPDGASELQATLRKAIANIDAASTPVTGQGNRLPDSFIDFLHPKKTMPDASPMKVGFMGLKPENLYDQQTLVSLVTMLMKGNPEMLLPVLQERANTLPPTVADYIIYRTSLDSLHDALSEDEASGLDEVAPRQGHVALPQGIGLLSLAYTKNPIYRLISVEAAPFVEANETNRVNFYSAFANEADPTLQTSALVGLAGTKSPATLGTLQSFQAATQQNGNARGAKVAEEAMPATQP